MSNVINLFSQKKIMKHGYGSGATEPFTHVHIKLQGDFDKADALRRAAIAINEQFEPEPEKRRGFWEGFFFKESLLFLIGYVCGIIVMAI